MVATPKQPRNNLSVFKVLKLDDTIVPGIKREIEEKKR